MWKSGTLVLDAQFFHTVCVCVVRSRTLYNPEWKNGKQRLFNDSMEEIKSKGMCSVFSLFCWDLGNNLELPEILAFTQTASPQNLSWSGPRHLFFFLLFPTLPLTPKEMNKDDFLEEVHKFLLLPASGVQVLSCRCFSFPKQISILLLTVAQHIHCFYKEGLVKAVDATFCLFGVFLVFIILLSTLNLCQ